MRRAVATSAFHALLRSPMRPTAATATAAALSRRPLLATSSFSAFTTNASNAVSRSKRPADAKKGMQIAFFSAHQYDIDSMTSIAQKEGIADDHELLFFENRLSVHNAQLATGCEGVVIFVNDTANEAALRKLYANGTRALFLRCAGYDMVDLNITKELDMPVMRVPAYSPFAIAEHAAALMMTLNRKIHRSFNRTREQNFRLDGLLGSDINGKTVGVIGTGKIGALFARICSGFGCNVLAYDVMENPEALSYGVKYVSLDEIWTQSDIISLHCPLFPSTRHVVNKESIAKMKDGVTVINTSRGGLIDTPALVKALKSKKVGAVGLDVFEGEGDYFYEDRSGAIIADDTLARLFTFPNVIITGHQAYFTKEALDSIAHTTMENIRAYVQGTKTPNLVENGEPKK